MSETEDNSKKDGIAWMKKLQAEKHAETLAIVEKAMEKPEEQRSGEEFLASIKLKAAEREESFRKKSLEESRLEQKSESSK